MLKCGYATDNCEMRVLKLSWRRGWLTQRKTDKASERVFSTYLRIS